MPSKSKPAKPGPPAFDADFYPYGTEHAFTDTCPPTHQFTGYEYDSKTGSYYASARYYNPRLGRFMSPDPLQGDVLNPQSLNRYAYVLNNPESLIDPLGLQCQGTNDPSACGPPCPAVSCTFYIPPGSTPLQLPGMEGGNPASTQNQDLIYARTGLGGGARPPQKLQTPACKTGFGFGVEGGGDASLGIGYTGAAATGSGGAGMFFGGGQWVSAGAYASGGATAYTGPHVAGAPAQTAGSPMAVGGGVGGGGGVFFTNASSASQLSGPFFTLAGGASFGMVGLSVQISEGKAAAGNTIWEFSASYTPGFGLYGYGLTTSTKAVATGAPCQ